MVKRRDFGADQPGAPPQSGAGRAFAVAGAFRLGSSLPPGRYVLQLAAQTAGGTRGGKVASALQQMDFDVK